MSMSEPQRQIVCEVECFRYCLRSSREKMLVSEGKNERAVVKERRCTERSEAGKTNTR